MELSAEIQQAGDYGSEFEYDSEVDAKRRRREDLAVKKKHSGTKVAKKEELNQEYEKDERIKSRIHFLSLDAYSRHKQMVNCYLQYYSGSAKDFVRDTSRDKTDIDVIRENHQFLWDEDDSEESWGKRLAKKYYDKLFKEYSIADLSRYKENKVAMRWRTENEVVDGKGQFVCGNRKCVAKEALRSWEVNFGYIEHEEKKNALVKLRLCAECSHKLNYHHRKREIKAKKRKREDSREKEHIDLTKDIESEVTASLSDKPKHSTEESTSSKSNPKDKEKEAEKQPGTSDDNLWAGPAKLEEDKSRDEEFEDYFEDMFM